MAVSVLVFTRDLRISDNPALTAAAAGGQVVPLFVLDDAIMRRHAGSATRLAFLLGSLRALDARLRSLGGHLVVRAGPWTEAVLRVADQVSAASVHVADDVSGYAQRRLAALELGAAAARRTVVRHPGVMITAPAALSPAGGGAYRVFTPYYLSWASYECAVPVTRTWSGTSGHAWDLARIGASASGPMVWHAEGTQVRSCEG